MSDFGRSLSRHAGTFGAGGWLWYLGGVAGAAGLFGVGRGVLGVAGVLTPVPGYSPVETLVMGLISLVACPLLLIVPVMRWRQTLEIFEGGVVWTRLLGAQSWPRAQLRAVRHITHHSRQGTSYEVEVTLADGTVHGVVGIEQSDQAANLIHQVLQGPAPAAAAAPASTGWRPPGAA